MPVCTTCTHPADYIYTTYRTKSNIRLNVCSKCNSFIDPLIEHPTLLLILDLILLKPRVFLHLMYNRGTKPLDATVTGPKTDITGLDQRDSVLGQDLVRLAAVTVIAETLVRLNPPQYGTGDSSVLSANLQLKDMEAMWNLIKVVGTVILELSAQYITTLGLALAILWMRNWWVPGNHRSESRSGQVDGRRENFKPIVIPLTLLFTSILPLLLHLILSIWSKTPSSTHLPESNTFKLPSSISAHLPPHVDLVLEVIQEVWANTDRIWAGTRLLGGMSAGFGLRVILPTKPWETTGIVLAGWGAAAGVASILHQSRRLFELIPTNFQSKFDTYVMVDANKTKTLNDGTVIPLLAYGTATVHNGRNSTPEILRALQKGFRHIETSRMYKNETCIRDAIDQWEGGSRKDIFIQSNWGEKGDGQYEHDPERSLMETLELLGTDYLDLYLIYGPNLMHPLTLIEAWRKMEEFHERGLVKSIGISSFPSEEIEQLAKVWKIKPSINQVEYHPLCCDLPRMRQMRESCHTYDIAVEPFTALAPLTRWSGGPVQIAAEEIAREKGITAAQVLLAWARQMTGGPIVTTCRKEYQYQEILDSLDIILTDSDIDLIAVASKESPRKRAYARRVWQDADNEGALR